MFSRTEIFRRKSESWFTFIQLCNKSRFQKNETVVNISKVANKVELANLKSDVDKLVIDKLKNVPINLSSFKRKVDTLDRYWKIKNDSTWFK